MRVKCAVAKESMWVRIRSGGAVLASDPMPKTEAFVCVVPAGTIAIDLEPANGVRAPSVDVELAPGEDREIVLGDGG
jgi:hypothetical protein